MVISSAWLSRWDKLSKILVRNICQQKKRQPNRSHMWIDIFRLPTIVETSSMQCDTINMYFFQFQRTGTTNDNTPKNITKFDMAMPCEVYIIFSTKLKILHHLINTWKKTRAAQETYRILSTGRNGYWSHSVNNMLMHPDDWQFETCVCIEN